MSTNRNEALFKKLNISLHKVYRDQIPIILNDAFPD